ncbi:class I SAM-dependent methyltransferase [Candidatus Woesearchaeota archaeon]|nr:class I SAM-dependent methyltransferase [Candidatus Woesearchaeota archaeon]
MTILNLLKKLPIDLGQANLRKTTKGKLIALSHVPKGNGKKALDVGCREGYQTKWLEKKGYEVTSIDIEKKYEACRIVDVNKRLPFDDRSFDLIWCSEVIEHLDNPQKTLQEFRRVLRNDGRIIITTPNSYCTVFRIAYLFGLTPPQMQNKGHKHFWGINKIRKLFLKAKIRGFFPYSILKMEITSLVGLLSPTFVIIEQKKTERKKER